MERSNLSYVSCCSAAVMPVDAEKLEEQLSLKKKKISATHLKLNLTLILPLYLQLR
jgi:hypothetical protein